MTGFIGCKGCNCLLREEDGPLCQACQDAAGAKADAKEERAERAALKAETEDVEPSKE